MVIAAVVGRVIWPVLPQKLLRDDLLNFFLQLKSLLNGEPEPEKIRTQLAILPVEAQQAARQIRVVGYSGEERAKISQLVRGLQALVMHTEALTSDMRGLPETTKSVLRPEFEQLEAELTQLMELANRYQSTAEALERCSSIMRTLKLERYMGDYAL